MVLGFLSAKVHLTEKKIELKLALQQGLIQKLNLHRRLNEGHDRHW